MIQTFLRPLLFLTAFTLLIPLGGCAGIARGVTEAVLEEQKDQQDTRRCEIEGKAFDGLRQSLDSQTDENHKTTKVLMVHGISAHLPGYSNRFQKMLFEKLGLDVTDATVKTIQLTSPDIVWRDKEQHTLGTLRITHHTNADRSRQLIFYELTWSPITSQQKQDLAADSANNDGLERADLNGTLKSFINDTVPDLLIYNGNGFKRITTSVIQSVCWMLSNDWDNLPQDGSHSCENWKGSTFAGLEADDHFFITHSLGSRITIDTIQNFSSLNEQQSDDPRRRMIHRAIRNKAFTVFMMANQLPLLQMGRDAPQIVADEKSYCEASSPKAKERVMKHMNIVAFSDPNDILSYPVPANFAANWIDSRICPSVTNVSLNIAEQKSLFDTATFANPMTAHSGYMEDDRVIDLIANGLHHDAMAPIIAQRCRWIESTDLEKTTRSHTSMQSQKVVQDLFADLL